MAVNMYALHGVNVDCPICTESTNNAVDGMPGVIGHNTGGHDQHAMHVRCFSKMVHHELAVKRESYWGDSSYRHNSTIRCPMDRQVVNISNGVRTMYQNLNTQYSYAWRNGYHENEIPVQNLTFPGLPAPAPAPLGSRMPYTVTAPMPTYAYAGGGPGAPTGGSSLFQKILEYIPAILKTAFVVACVVEVILYVYIPGYFSMVPISILALGIHYLAGQLSSSFLSKGHLASYFMIVYAVAYYNSALAVIDSLQASLNALMYIGSLIINAI